MRHRIRGSFRGLAALGVAMTALFFAGVALQAGIASANTTETVKQASIDSHATDCTNQLIGNVKFSAHFIITQVDNRTPVVATSAPATITVTWSDTSTEIVALDDPAFNGNAASYTTTQHAGLTVLTATASLYDGWEAAQGQFNLSHYNCGDLATISIGPSAVNDIGKGETSHTFTVTVNGTSMLNPITVTTTVNAAPVTCASLTGVGTTTVTCTVTVTSSVPAGPFVAHAAAVGTVGATLFNIATNGVAPNSGDATKLFACQTHALNLSITGAGKSTVSHTGLTTGGWTVTFDYTYQTYDGTSWSGTTAGSATGTVLADGGVGALTIGVSPIIATPNATYHARVQWTFTIRDNTNTVLFGPSGTKPTPSTYVDLDNVGNCSGSDSAVSPVSDVTAFKVLDPEGDGGSTVFDTGISGWTITATSPGNDPISGVTVAGGSVQLVGLDDLVTWTICESPARTTPSETQWIQTFPSFGGCYTRQDLAHRTTPPDYVFGNTPGTSTTVTTLHKPNGDTVANGSQLDLGSSIYDTAAVTSFPTPQNAPAATGTVTFTLYSGTCVNGVGSGSPLLASNNVALGSPSDTWGPLAAGDYYVVAVYSGDTRYASSTGTCEPFHIKKADLSLVTTMYSGQIVLANGGQLPAGTLPRSVRDTATASGLVDGFTPANNVTFSYFTNGTCANTGAAAGSVALVGNLADGSATESITAAGSYSFLASIASDANYNGASATCESFTVTTVTINKLANGGNATFSFTLGDQTASITTQGTPGTGSTTLVVLAGALTLGEGSQDGWQLVSIACGTGGTPSFTAAAGTNTTCNVENTHNGATRTQGFWATHTAFANARWASVPTSGAYSIPCVSQTITALTGNNQNILMGSFWSSIGQTSTGAKRTALGKARMQLLQQLTAALLNKYGLGADDQGKIAAAITAYCGTSTNAITNATGVLSTWNQSGDTVPLNAPSQNATVATSKTQANLTYWDTHNQ